VGADMFAVGGTLYLYSISYWWTVHWGSWLDLEFLEEKAWNCIGQ